MHIKGNLTVVLLTISVTVFGSTEPLPNPVNNGLNFEQNKGQFNPAVKFIARGKGYQVTFGELPVIGLLDDLETRHSDVEKNTKSLSFKIDIQGASQSAEVVGVDQLILKTNYIRGHKDQWITDANNFKKVKYINVLEGIDAVYYGNQGRLEYDFLVKPGVDPKQIQVAMLRPVKLSVAEGQAIQSMC